MYLSRLHRTDFGCLYCSYVRHWMKSPLTLGNDLCLPQFCEFGKPKVILNIYVNSEKSNELMLPSDAVLLCALCSGHSSLQHPLWAAFVLSCWPTHRIHLSADVCKTPFSQSICVFGKLDRRLLLLFLLRKGELWE